MKKLFLVSILLLMLVVSVATAQSDKGNQLLEWQNGSTSHPDGFSFPQCEGTQNVTFFVTDPGAEIWTVWTREKRDRDGNLLHLHHHREGTATYGDYGYTFVWDIVSRSHWVNGEQVDSYNETFVRSYSDANGIYAIWERGHHNDESYSNLVCLRSNI